MTDVVTAADHLAFCVAEGWTRVRRTREHETYELVVDDGSTLRTRVALDPLDAYAPAFLAHVLAEQLGVDAATLDAFRRTGNLPPRTALDRRAPGIPVAVVVRLLACGLSESDAAGLDETQARAYLERFAAGE